MRCYLLISIESMVLIRLVGERQFHALQFAVQPLSEVATSAR